MELSLGRALAWLSLAQAALSAPVPALLARPPLGWAAWVCCAWCGACGCAAPP